MKNNLINILNSNPFFISKLSKEYANDFRINLACINGFQDYLDDIYIKDEINQSKMDILLKKWDKIPNNYKEYNSISCFFEEKVSFILNNSKVIISINLKNFPLPNFLQKYKEHLIRVLNSSIHIYSTLEDFQKVCEKNECLIKDDEILKAFTKASCDLLRKNNFYLCNIFEFLYKNNKEKFLIEIKKAFFDCLSNGCHDNSDDLLRNIRRLHYKEIGSELLAISGVKNAIYDFLVKFLKKEIKKSGRCWLLNEKEIEWLGDSYYKVYSEFYLNNWNKFQYFPEDVKKYINNNGLKKAALMNKILKTNSKTLDQILIGFEEFSEDKEVIEFYNLYGEK